MAHYSTARIFHRISVSARVSMALQIPLSHFLSQKHNHWLLCSLGLTSRVASPSSMSSFRPGQKSNYEITGGWAVRAKGASGLSEVSPVSLIPPLVSRGHTKTHPCSQQKSLASNRTSWLRRQLVRFHLVELTWHGQSWWVERAYLRVLKGQCVLST